MKHATQRRRIGARGFLLGAIVALATPAAGDAPFSAAQWIAPSAHAGEGVPLFRKEFVVASAPRKATLRVVGLGDYEPRLNGKPITSTGANQPWSQYEKTLFYRELDVTRKLKTGTNCLAVTLTNSFWDNREPPAGRYYKQGPQRIAEEPLLLLAELVVEGDDGATQRVVSDTSWRWREGPVVFSHVYAGEDYDARREQPGWDHPGFDDATWRTARAASGPGSELRRQRWPAVETQERFAAESVTEPEPGVWLYAFPQNCSAQLRVNLTGGEPGARVGFRCGEHKSPQGRLFGHYVVGCGLVTNGEPLTRQWSSFYLGMQFVEVTGAVPEGRPNPDGLPVVESLELVHVRTALPVTGEFRCSSELYNATHRVVDWAMRSNTHHVLTDCPHREKLGWLEVPYLLARGFEYRYDCRDWFDKLTIDIRDAQLPAGRVLTVAPSYPAGRFSGGFDWTVEWGAAAVLLPWRQYEWSGDPQVLRDNFPMMRAFVDHVEKDSVDGLAPAGLGDWYDYGHGQPPGPSRFTPPTLSATATWAICARAVAEAADVLGKPDEARRYREMHARIETDFCRHFRDGGSGVLTHNGSPQCAHAMAICAKVVGPAEHGALVEQIVGDLRQREWQQTTGDIGHVYFIRALAEAGRSDVLHRVYGRDGPGSYGGVVRSGLTTMPETWDAVMDGYQSLNHCMLGHVVEWFYAYVAGIRQPPGGVGWRDVLIAPEPGPLTHAEARVATPRGVVVSRWRIEDGEFRLEATIPEGVSAAAVLPSGARRPLRAGRQTLTEPWGPR